MRRVVPKRYLVLGVVVLLLSNISIYQKIFNPVPTHVVIHKSGKGMVALVIPPHAQPMLINTGSDASVLRFLGETLAPWQRTLAVLVLTSAKKNQAGGASEVLGRYQVAHIVRLGTRGSKTQEIALAVAQPAATQTLRVAYGSELAAPGVVVTFIGPQTVLLRTQNKTLVVSSTTSAVF